MGHAGVGEMLGSGGVVSVTGVGHACCDVLDIVGLGELVTSSVAEKTEYSTIFGTDFPCMAIIV